MNREWRSYPECPHAFCRRRDVVGAPPLGLSMLRALEWRPPTWHEDHSTAIDHKERAERFTWMQKYHGDPYTKHHGRTILANLNREPTATLLSSSATASSTMLHSSASLPTLHSVPSQPSLGTPSSLRAPSSLTSSGSVLALTPHGASSANRSQFYRRVLSKLPDVDDPYDGRRTMAPL